MRAFADLVRQGKVALHRRLRVDGRADPRRPSSSPSELGFDRIVSNQPQYSMLWRVIEAEVVPDLRGAGIGQIVWSPIAQGVLTGKYLPGQPPPAGSRATDRRRARTSSSAG